MPTGKAAGGVGNIPSAPSSSIIPKRGEMLPAFISSPPGVIQVTSSLESEPWHHNGEESERLEIVICGNDGEAMVPTPIWGESNNRK